MVLCATACLQAQFCKSRSKQLKVQVRHLKAQSRDSKHCKLKLWFMSFCVFCFSVDEIICSPNDVVVHSPQRPHILLLFFATLIQPKTRNGCKTFRQHLDCFFWWNNTMQSSVFDKMTGKEVQQSNSSWKDGMWVQLSGHLHIETLTWTMSHVGVETEAITTCWLHNAENWTIWSTCKRHQMQQNWQNGCTAPHSSMHKMIKTTLWQTTLKMKWKWICQTHAKLHVILRFDQSLMQHVTCSSQSRRSGTLLAMPATPWVPSKHLKSFFHNQTTISKPFLVSNNNWHHLGTLS